MLLQWDPRGAMGAHLFRYLTGFVRNYERGSGKYMYQVVKRDGKIVERGTHADLLSRGGFYAKLYNSQFAPS